MIIDLRRSIDLRYLLMFGAIFISDDLVMEILSLVLSANLTSFMFWTFFRALIVRLQKILYFESKFSNLKFYLLCAVITPAKLSGKIKLS